MAACNVITVALSTGAQANQVAHRVASLLRFRCVDDEIITMAADKAGVSPEEVDQVEHSMPLVRRILDSMATLPGLSPMELLAAQDSFGMVPDDLVRGAIAIPNDSASYRDLIREVIRQTAAQGKVVIVTHGASIHLAGMEVLLRVFVTGSPEVRAQRLALADGLSEQEAKRRIEHTDKERRAFLQRFYQIRQELPIHYDLVVNTDRLSPAAAADAIVAAANSIG